MSILNKFRERYFLLTAASIIITFLILYLIRSLSLGFGSDIGVDVYYHVKAGDMFTYISSTKQFPWVEMSLWKTAFSDKELGFHFILFILRKVTNAFGISPYPPFNFMSSFFFGIILLLFGFWSYFKCKKIAFVIPVLLIFISPVFFQKLIILRPDLVSIILFSITVFVLLGNSSFYRKIFYIFILGWLYSICYSVPHVMLMAVIVYCIASFLSKHTFKDKIRSLLFILFAVLGLILGLTVHPQFPNTFTNLYIQGYEVVLNILGLSSSKVGLGEGLKSPVMTTVLENTLVYLLLAVNLFIFKFISKKEDTDKKIFVLILQFITVLGFFLSKRTIEYAVPSIIICFVYLVSCYEEERGKVPNILSNGTGLIIFALAFIVVMVPINKKLLKNMQLPPCYSFAKWAEFNLPKGTYIGLINFGDFPRLFYVAPEYKYSMAMDPMFSYYAYPERANTVEQFRLGYDFNITPKQLAEAYGTNYLYAPKYYRNAVMYLLEKGAKLLYYDKEGCLLRL